MKIETLELGHEGYGYFGIYVDGVQVGVGPRDLCDAAAAELRDKPAVAEALREDCRNEGPWNGWLPVWATLVFDPDRHNLECLCLACECAR